jgi:hypothetical protein
MRLKSAHTTDANGLTWRGAVLMSASLQNRNFQMLTTNGVRLRTVVEGEGPLVILLHGFPQC